MLRRIALTGLVWFMLPGGAALAAATSKGAPAAAPSATSTAASDLKISARPANPVDSLRTAALEARLSLRWEEAARLRRELLARNSGDGFAIRELAREALNRGCLADLAAALHGAVACPVALPKLDEAERCYLEGVIAFSRDRLASAGRQLDRAIALRPSWGWAQLYRARCADAAMEPVAVCEAHVRSALDDADAVPEVAAWLLDDEVRGFEGFSKANGARLHAAVQGIPWVAHSWAQFHIYDRFRYGTWTEAWSDSMLRAVRSGPAAAEFVDNLGWAIKVSLAPLQALKLIDRYEREATSPGEKARWPAVRAEILATMGNTYAADSVLAAGPLQNAENRQTRLEWRIGYEAASVLDAEASWLVAEDLRRSSVLAAQGVWTQLARDDSVRSLWDQVRVENPPVAMRDRLARHMRSDRNAAKIYADSLAAAGYPPLQIQYERLLLAEQTGDTLAARDLLRLKPEASVPWFLAAAASAAFEQGRDGRGNRLTSLALEKGAAQFRLLLNLGDEALQRGERTRVIEIGRVVDACCPHCPESELRTAEWELSLGDERRARAVIRDPSKALRGPSAQGRRAYLALRLDEMRLADSLSAAAMKQDSTLRDVRWTRAMVLSRQGNAPGAQVIARSLTVELPGREDYKQLAGSIGGAPDWGQGRARPDEGDPFSVLSHDLTSTAWIVERMAQRDTLGPAVAVNLQQRMSYLATDHRVRFRKVMKLQTQQAVEIYGSIRISFDAAVGPPSILVARVIDPGGRVADVPRGQIVIGSGQEGDADVADSRYLVIPFGGLKVGCVLDLGWEERHETFGPSWSSRCLFNDDLPSRECIVEVVSARDAPIRFQQGAGEGPPERSSIGSYDVARWTVRDLPAQRHDDLAGSIYNQNRWAGFSTHRSWERSLSSYPVEFWRRVRPSDEVVKLAVATKGVTNPALRAQSLLDSVSNRVRYFAVELGQGRFVPAPAGEVLERGFGDCKDLVTLAIATLEAAGIDAEPVLVTSRNEITLGADLAEPERFTHMVLWTPKIRGGCYTDLTMNPPCLGAIGSAYEGTVGLRFGRNGTAVPVTLPSTPPESHGYTMAIDVRPRGDGSADIEVAAQYRGGLARVAAALLGAADTSLANTMADRILGFGLPPSSKRLSWGMQSNTCAGVTAKGVYRDTAWSDQTHSVALAIRDEVADPLLQYPGLEDRPGGVRLDHGYRDTVIVRLHPGSDWEPVAQLVSTSLRRPNYAGEITVQSVTSGAKRWIEVRQTFELLTRDLSRDAYAAFHRDWLRFQAVVYQPYRYRRGLDRNHMEQVRAYVRQHPDDSGYALQAAQAILGDDMGGDGPDGAERRTVCRELLQPSRQDPRVGAWPQIYLCGMAVYDGRMRAADSLALEALQREEGNMFALAFLVSIREALGDRSAELSYLKDMARRYPSDEMQYQLLMKLYRDGKENEARDIEVRLASLRGSVDTSRVAMAKLTGYLGAGRCEEARAALDDLRRIDPAVRSDVLEAMVQVRCEGLARAAELLERLWLDDPLNQLYCNDLAWVYALLGRDLDLAEEIAKITVTMSVSARRGAQNTLAVIQARRGRWSDAREIFDSLLRDSEDLEGRAANAYFLALCDYELGRKTEAVARWRDLLPKTPPGEWRVRTSKSLELAARGLPPRDAVFAKSTNVPRP